MSDLATADVLAVKEHCRLLYQALARCYLCRSGQAPAHATADDYVRQAEVAVEFAQDALAAAEEHLGVAKGRKEGN